MAKRTKKVSINLTQEEWDILNALAKLERRTLSELAYLIVVDTSQELFIKKQTQEHEFKVAKFTPSDEFGNVKL